MKGKFLTVGTGLFLILTIFFTARWIDGRQARDKYRHCQLQHADEVFTDQQAHDMDVFCADKSGYTLNRSI